MLISTIVNQATKKPEKKSPLDDFIKSQDEKIRDITGAEKPKTIQEIVKEQNESRYKKAGVKSAAQLSAKSPGTFVYEVNNLRGTLKITKGSEKDKALKGILSDRVADGKITKEELAKVSAMFQDGSYEKEYKRLVQRNAKSQQRKKGIELDFTEEDLRTALKQGLSGVKTKDGKSIDLQDALEQWAKAGFDNIGAVKPETQEEQDMRQRGEFSTFEGIFDKMTKQEQEDYHERNIRSVAHAAGDLVRDKGPAGEVTAGVLDFVGDVVLSPADAIMNFGRMTDPDKKPIDRGVAGFLFAIDSIPFFGNAIGSAAGKGIKTLVKELRAFKNSGRAFEKALAKMPIEKAAQVRIAFEAMDEVGEDALAEAVEKTTKQAESSQKANISSETPNDVHRAVNTPEISNNVKVEPDKPADFVRVEPDTPTQVDETPTETPNKVDNVSERRSLLKTKADEARARIAERERIRAEKEAAGEVEARSVFSDDDFLDLIDKTLVFLDDVNDLTTDAVRRFLASQGHGDKYDQVEKTLLDMGITPRKATGLANQVQEREALAGIINEIAPSQGRTMDEIFESGRDAFDTNQGYIKLAEDVANGDAPITADNISKLLHGKARLMSEVDNIAAKLAEKPNNRKLLNELHEAEDQLQDYLKNIQQGKGKWSDAGRALQMGTTYEGSLADVIARMERAGKEVDAKTFQDIRKLTDKIKESDNKIAELEKRLQAQASIPRVPRVSKQVARTNFDQAKAKTKALWDEGNFFRKDTSIIGAVPGPPRLTEEAWQAIKDLAKSSIQLGYTNIDEIVQHVKQTLKGYNIDVDDQEIIDSIASTGPGKTRTELQKQVDQLRKQARNMSTRGKETKLDRQAERLQKANESQVRADMQKAKTARDNAAKKAEEARKKHEAAMAKKREADAKRVKERIENAAKKREKQVSDANQRQTDAMAKKREADSKRVRERMEAAAERQAKKDQEALDKAAQDLQKANEDYVRKAKELEEKAEAAKKKKLDAATARLEKANEAYSKKVADLQAEINRLKQMRNDGTYTRSSEKKRKALTEELENLRAQKEDLKKILDVEYQIAEINRQIDTGEYIDKPVRESKASQELADLRAERDIASGRLRRIRDEHDMSAARKVVRTTAELIRGLKLGSDLGIITRQGLFAWSPQNAKDSWGALVRAAKSAFSEGNAAKYQRAINEARLNDGTLAAVKQKKAGLSMSDRLTDPEELSVSRLLKKIPLVGEAIGGSLDRFQHVFINQVRSDTFNRAANLGYSEKELIDRAKFINAVTGRGNLSGPPSDLLQVVMTSPRYEASRWQTLWEGVKNPLKMVYNPTNRAARQNVADMAATAAELAGLMVLAKETGGYELEFDMTSSDFLKMRRGEEVWDPTAGLGVRIRDLSRVALILASPDRFNNLVAQGATTGGRTLSPVVRTGITLGSEQVQKVSGNEDLKDPFSGYEEDFTDSMPLDDDVEKLLKKFAPLVVVSTLDTLASEGPGAAVGAGFKEFIGQSINRYPSSDSTPYEKYITKQYQRNLDNEVRAYLEDKSRDELRRVRKIIENADYISDSKKKFYQDVLAGKEGIDDEKFTKELDEKIESATKENARELLREVNRAKFLSEAQKKARRDKLNAIR